jgi:RNA polymerase sigma-70 factor (ECF subfamily)
MQALYDAHAAAVYRFLLRFTFGQRQTAEDLTQETMLRAWRNIDKLNVKVEALRPWLLTVARRVAIDAGRARLSRPSELDGVDLSILPAPEDHIDRILRVESIRSALMQLSPEHRGVIVELYLKGRSVPQTAEVLGVPAGTVKSRAYYGLRALRATLGSRAAHA